MKKIVLCCACALGLNLAAIAADGIDKLVFGNAVISQDVVQMGGNSLISGSDAWNPMNMLSSDTFMNASVAYQGWAPASAVSTDNISTAIGGKLGSRLSLTLACSAAFGQRYEEYGADGKVLGVFSPKDLSLEAGLGFKLSKILAVGGKLRYMNSSFAKDSEYMCVMGDVFASAKFNDLTVRVAGLALGSDMVIGDEHFCLPSSVAAGAEYDFRFASCVLSAQAQGDYYLYGGGRMGAGIDFCWNEMLSARVGYCLSFDAPVPSFLSLGVGAGYGGVSFNASYLISDSPINGTMLMGVVFELK